MSIPHSDARDTGRTAVLIPLRSLRSGKARLAGAIEPDARNRLIELMARRVVEAAHDLDVLIVHDDPAVAIWAAEVGAKALRPETPGLNEAVRAGHAHLRDSGYERVIIAHADLPLASDLRVMCTGHEIAIAPDRTRTGTNVLAVPTTLDFPFEYGVGSFEKHVANARRLGIEPHIVEDPQLALDVDEPDDLLETNIEPIQHVTENDRGADN